MPTSLKVASLVRPCAPPPRVSRGRGWLKTAPGLVAYSSCVGWDLPLAHHLIIGVLGESCLPEPPGAFLGAVLGVDDRILGSVLGVYDRLLHVVNL